MAVGPFDLVRAVGETKRDLVREDEVPIRDYNPFLTNRAFSQHRDSIHFANAMNQAHHMELIMQYDFYLNGLPKKKR